MNELLTVLYQHACKHRLAAYLLDEEYEKLSAGLEKREAALLKTLLGEDRLSFTYYCDEMRLHQEQDRQAAFQAGFALALELITNP